MDALNFSVPLGTAEEDYCFGVDNAETAKTLRRLARNLEQGKLAVQHCRVLSSAKIGDFTSTSLRITFSEKRVRETTKDKLTKLSTILPTKPLREEFKESINYVSNKFGIKSPVKKLYAEEKFPVAIGVPDSIR